MHLSSNRIGFVLGLVCGPFVTYGDLAGDEPLDLSALPPAATRPVDFLADVQPVLQKTCYSCHGPEKDEGGLRLDDRRRALDGGDGGKAIVPGKSAESRLIHLVAGLDEDAGRMPPDGEGTPLSPEQVGLLRAWIDQGANWPDQAQSNSPKADHWSLQPIAAPRTPAVRDPTWSLTGVDPFILARLDELKIVPAPPADRVTLMRRLYLDLIGLPPSPGEVASHVADESPAAYERLVDRLLSSPHFGERWGRHWLDLARYADSDGYEKDRPRPFAWRYREWVLAAINGDLPYSQFTTDQLAGDLLPDATLDQRVASGFHRNTLHNTEGGADPEEDRFKKTVDRTNTFGTTWLGLTVGCAQCHSHKYDPFTQREYYQLYAFFNNLDETDIGAPVRIEQERYEQAKADHDRRHQPLVAALRKYEREQLPAAQATWERDSLATSLVWTPLAPSSAKSRQEAKLKIQEDQSVLASGANKDSDVYVVEAASPLPTIRAIRLEVLPDDSLDQKGPGRADNGNFVLATFSVEVVGDKTSTRIKLKNPQADFSQESCDISHAINDNVDDFWAVAPQFAKRHVASFECGEPIQLAEGMKLRITLDQKYNHPDRPHNLGRFRLSVTNGLGRITLEGLPPEVAASLAVPAAARSADQATAMTNFFRTLDPEWLRLNQAVEDHARKGPKAPDTKAQTITQRKELRDTSILIRGDFLNPGDRVEPATPALLPPLKPRGARPDRLDLAQWLTAEENPLTARVAVNRVWERIFGRGLVSTVDDFGKQGSAPSHPELLDWLAASFRGHGWSLKHLIREIVLSATYRQSSAVRTELLAIDPENIWLARQQRRRLEAEVIRDAALAVSGLFDSRIGGPSVHPPQPAEYADLTYANSARWNESQGGDRYRRGMYTFFQRTSPYPMLVTFDAPDSNECCARRESSNTPLQALTLWNDPAFQECARAFGREIMRAVPGTSQDAEFCLRRAEFAFQRALARSPTADELQEVMALFSAQRAIAREVPEQAAILCGMTAGGDGSSLADLAAWIMVGRTLLNLDEFITRE